MAGEKKYQFAFSGGEIFVILSLLLFIAAFLFTLGVMLGKSGSFDLKSLTSVKKSLESSEDEANIEDDFDEYESEEYDFALEDDDLDLDEIDDFEKDKKKKVKSDKKVEKKVVAGEKELSKEKVAKKLPDNTKKDNKEKESLSFYKELKDEKTTVSAARNKKNNFPMISKELLMSKRGKYTVQVAAYAKETDAVSKTLLLKKSCCPGAYYVVGEVPNKGVWYQVRIGFFDRLKNAKNFANRLKRQKRIAEYVIKVVR